MRIIFIGQAPFGAESLQKLIAQGEEIVGVITIRGYTEPETSQSGEAVRRRTQAAAAADPAAEKPCSCFLGKGT